MLKGKRILLIVAGGIAAFKSLELIRRLRERGASVRCVLTEAGGIGRTEQFTQVKLPSLVARGLMLNVSVAGHDGRQLIAA